MDWFTGVDCRIMLLCVLENTSEIEKEEVRFVICPGVFPILQVALTSRFSILLPDYDGHFSIQRLPVPLYRYDKCDRHEKGNGPEVYKDLRQTVPFQENAPDDTQKMGQRQC